MMTLEQQRDLAVWSEGLIQIAIALIALHVGIRARQILIGVLVGVCVAWVAAYQFRVHIVTPLGIAYYDSVDPERMYDGVGDNAATLLAGWLLPLGVVLVALLLRAIRNRLRLCHGLTIL